MILADEPTGNVDTGTGDEIMSLLREANERGNTVLLVTHERRVAERADRIITITDGAIEGVEQLRQLDGVEAVSSQRAADVLGGTVAVGDTIRVDYGGEREEFAIVGIPIGLGVGFGAATYADRVVR